MIPGLELIPLAESELCCGAAGSYNLTQPEMAERLGRPQGGEHPGDRGEAVFTGNVGCLLQIGRHLREAKAKLWVRHPRRGAVGELQRRDAPLSGRKTRP